MVVDVKNPKDVKKTSTKDEKQKEMKPFTKIVVRRLPPRLSKDDFVETIGPLAENDYFHFVAADSSLEPHAFSRAYINFVNSEDVFSFRDKFDGYVFVDDRGNEYQALVEFAPYQKVPKPCSKSKKDPKSGTIESDPDFLSFVESLDKPDASSIFNPETYLEELETKEKEAKVKEITPLIEFIRDKKAEKVRMREERMDARRKRDDDRRKVREEERKRRKENAEKNFLEMMNEKIKADDAADERPKEEKSRVRDSAKGGGGSDKDRNRAERFPKDERSNDREKERQRRRDEDRQRRKEKQREKERERRKETRRYSDKEMSEEKKKEEQSEKKEIIQTEAQTDDKKIRTDDKKMRAEGKREEMGKHFEDDEASRIRRENRARRERIKNKERPAMEIYRPGMGKFSSQTLKAGESKNSRSNSPEEPETEDKQLEASKRSEKSKRSGNYRERDQQQQQQREEGEATGNRSDRGGRRDSGRRKDESGPRDEKSGPVIIDERKRRPAADKSGFKDERPKVRDERGAKNRGKDEKSESGFRNRNRGERSGNKDTRSQEDRPPKEADFVKPINSSQTQKATEMAPKPHESQSDPTGDDGREPERRSGKSYLNKRRERQQEREERAAKEQDE